jgi:hypothetical protein
MKLIDAIARLGDKEKILERFCNRIPAVTAHILSLSLLALLTACDTTVEFRPSKAPRGITGAGGQMPPPVYPPIYPTSIYSPMNPASVYPPPSSTSIYPSPLPATDNYLGGVYPVGNPSAAGSGQRAPSAGGPSFTIKLTSRR